ncbi:DNA glycosylase AlkZ-like family protein [Loigolactobacillus binensis]|uniref:DNA glycosylase AlkZ-like family protein n=1 Tax=Loigolactobacillus binensis TaxID=2559922 RepID=A0ABW3EAA2_9LACO|nr:crosslink repair DNA glycosylase YcaQ family protein [Loigolactobacillus binensis]
MEITELFAIRLANSGLLQPFSTLPAALANTVGAQSQQITTPLMNMAVRTTNPTAAAWANLTTTHQIVRAWAQRWTLQVMCPADLQLVLSARAGERLPRQYYLGQTDWVKQTVTWLKTELNQQKAWTRAEFDTLLTAQLAPFSRKTGLRYVILQSLIAQGYGYFSAASSTTNWTLQMTTPKLMDPKPAITALIQRYLTGFGPASLTDFVRWSGIKISSVRPLWAKLAQTQPHYLVQGQALLSMTAYSPAELAALLHQAQNATLFTARFDALLTGYAAKGWLLTPAKSVAIGQPKRPW